MKLRSSYVCQQCGYESPQWYGKCPSCGSWNSLVETVKDVSLKEKKNKTTLSVSAPLKLSEVKHIESNRIKTGISEFDRVMGGGIVPGSVTLLSGDPGIGKSTLLLAVLGKAGGLYVAGEESKEQVKLRAKRLGINGENIYIISETNVETIIGQLSSISEKSSDNRLPGYKAEENDEVPQKNKSSLPLNKEVDDLSMDKRTPLVIIDSIQTVSSDDLEGMAGSVGQIRHCAEKIVAYSKLNHIPVIIIGHVNKEGSIAGPKILEHMVDTVLYLEGERFATARILRTLKNRFGAIEEVGLFEMAESGLKEIDNPSALFLQDRVRNVPGSVVTVLLEGTRPLLVEIQALVVPSQLAIPRRVGNGFDYNRLQLLVAVLQKRLNVNIGTFDIYVNVSGGIRVEEPSADLAVALAILSSYKNKAIDPKTAVFGELGLLGEARTTIAEDRRIKEANRLGFETIISPKTIKNVKEASLILS